MILRSVYPVRLKALSNFHHSYQTKELVALTGDLIEINRIDFSRRVLTVVNVKTKIQFEVYYDPVTWMLEGSWKFEYSHNYHPRNVAMVVNSALGGIKEKKFW